MRCSRWRSGEYFAGVGSAWVDERRHQLTEVATTARAAAAEAAYGAGRYPDAQRLAEAVVAADPLREAMWRTLMRVRSAVGDYDGVVSTFRYINARYGPPRSRPRRPPVPCRTSCAAEHPFRRIHVRTPTLISWRSDSH